MTEGAAPHCKYHPAVLATRVLPAGQGWICEDCWRLICVGKDPAKAAAIDAGTIKTPAPASEAAPMPKDAVQKFCKTPGCNTVLRADNKSGLCAKCQRGGKPKQPAPPKRIVSTGRGSGRFSDTIEVLREEMDRIQRVITELEAMN